MYAGVAPGRAQARALEALDRVGLGDRAEHRPGELSGGQQQRVAVARALVTDPALILADEPTGNLDSVLDRRRARLLDELHDAGRTIVLITHEADVRAAAQRVARIRDGLVVTRERPARRWRGAAVSWWETLRTGLEAVRTHRLRSA